MNNMIVDLYEKASEWALESDSTQSYKDRIMLKFAELIVKECVSIVDDAERGGSNEIWDNAVKFIRRDLQEHFGIEK